MANPTMKLKPLKYLQYCSHFGLSLTLLIEEHLVTLLKH